MLEEGGGAAGRLRRTFKIFDVVTGRLSPRKNTMRLPCPRSPYSNVPSRSMDAGGRGFRAVGRVPGDANFVPVDALNQVVAKSSLHVQHGARSQTSEIDEPFGDGGHTSLSLT
jgi:hypothetical protein